MPTKWTRLTLCFIQSNRSPYRRCYAEQKLEPAVAQILGTLHARPGQVRARRPNSQPEQRTGALGLLRFLWFHDALSLQCANLRP